MNRRFLLWIGMGLLLTGSVQAAPKWTTFTSREGRMTFLLPGKPMLNQRTEQTSTGTVVVRQFIAISPHDGTICYGMYSDLPEGADPSVSADARLDMMIGALVKHNQGTLRGAREVSFHGHPGRAYSIDKPNGYVVQYRSYMVGETLYTLGVCTRAAQADAPEVKRFLGSLKLLPKK
jgi:hypothetical protein